MDRWVGCRGGTWMDRWVGWVNTWMDRWVGGYMDGY